MDLADAQKQLQHLKDRMVQQAKEIDKQSQAISKLKEQYSRMTSAPLDTSGIRRLEKELAKAQGRAAELDTELQNAKRNAAIDKELYGAVSPEMAAEIKELDEELRQAETAANSIGIKLNELRLGPAASDGAKELAASIAEAEARLAELRAGMPQTEQEMTEAAAEVDRLSEYLQQMRESATVADEGIIQLQEELRTLQLRKTDLESAGLGLGYQEYDQLLARIQQINWELSEYRRQLESADSTPSESRLSWWSRISDMASKMRSVVVGAASAAGKAVAGLKSRIASLGREKGLDKTSNAATRLLGRLKRLIVGAFFFNLIRRQLRAIVTGIGRYLTANEQFARALSGIKSNLLTAFQPVYDSVMPALGAMMEALENVTARFASFMATVFGTTAEQAQKNAAALYEQAKATEETGEAAKKARKFLASFDTIEKIGDKDSDSKKGKTAPLFDTEFDKIKAPQWLLDFWKVFQDGWEQYGEPVMEAFRSAIGTIAELIRAIGAAFLSIWTGETGLAFLGDIAAFLETVLGIIHDIAAAFRAAWDTRGGAVIEALAYALRFVFALLISIGTAFREAWNDGSGVQICQTILSIITNILTTIGNLAGRLREAWEANGNGVAIWSVILDIVQDVLDFFNEIALATAQWTEGLDLEPIISGIRQLLETVEPLVDLLLGGLSWAWENILLPLAGWVIEEAAPAAVEVFAAAFEALASVLSALMPIFQALWAIVKPIAEFIGTVFVQALNALAAAIKAVGDLLTWLISLFTQAGSASNSLGTISGKIRTDGTSRASAYSLPRSYAYDSAAVMDAFPHLASGAVIAPNHEFLAVLGDQKSGTNIETPLSTMKQAFLEAIAESGIANRDGRSGVAELTLDGQKFARLIFPYTHGEQTRRGVGLVMGGA